MKVFNFLMILEFPQQNFSIFPSSFSDAKSTLSDLRSISPTNSKLSILRRKFSDPKFQPSDDHPTFRTNLFTLLSSKIKPFITSKLSIFRSKFSDPKFQPSDHHPTFLQPSNKLKTNSTFISFQFSIFTFHSPTRTLTPFSHFRFSEANFLMSNHPFPMSHTSSAQKSKNFKLFQTHPLQCAFNKPPSNQSNVQTKVEMES